MPQQLLEWLSPLIKLIFSGYEPPSRHRLGGELLDQIHCEQQTICRTRLEGKTVNTSIDGWSNIHNEPVLCVTVTDGSGQSYLSHTIDTAGKPHNSTYLKEVTQEAISNIEQRYNCTVGSLVTDNAANMNKMREELGEIRPEIIQYGCSAHQLNLLAKDLEITGIQQHIVQIVKYFRNHHLPSAWYKAAGGKKLPMVCEVRWNSVVDTLEAYITNWSKLLAVCEDHRDEIDAAIARKVSDRSIKRHAEDMISILKPVAVAIDRAQAADTTLADSVHIWMSLVEALRGILDRTKMKKVEERMKKNLTMHHYLAYVLTPKYCKSASLSDDTLEEVTRFVSSRYTSMLPMLMNFQARTGPFPPYRFSDDIINSVPAVTWWKSIIGLRSTEQATVLRILTSVCSTANVERVFSAFGLVHSKLRNRLGVEKAGKLVFLFKILN